MTLDFGQRRVRKPEEDLGSRQPPHRLGKRYSMDATQAVVESRRQADDE